MEATLHCVDVDTWILLYVQRTGMMTFLCTSTHEGYKYVFRFTLPTSIGPWLWRKGKLVQFIGFVSVAEITNFRSSDTNLQQCSSTCNVTLWTALAVVKQAKQQV